MLRVSALRCSAFILPSPVQSGRGLGSTAAEEEVSGAGLASGSALEPARGSAPEAVVTRDRPATAARNARRDQQGEDFGESVGVAFSIRKTIWRSPRSIASNRSPVTPTKCGMSITASGSVQRTSSRSPGAKDFKALCVLSAGRGHFSPDRSNLVTIMTRHVWVVRGRSIAKLSLMPPSYGAVAKGR